MVSASTVVLEYLCPGAGVICAGIMFSAPLRDVRQATLAANLGDLNPTPWAFMLGNCLGWITYACLKQNWFIFWGNAPGFLIACYLNLQACKLQYQGFHAQRVRQSIVTALEEESRSFTVSHTTTTTRNGERPHYITSDGMLDFAKIVWNVTAQNIPAPAAQETLVMCLIIFWLILLTIINMAGLEHTIQETIIGVAVNCNLIFFYGAPLSTIFAVLKTRACNSIHVPTMLTNTANGAFWCAYAIAVFDPFIAAPNGIGVLLGVIQMILCVLFPRTRPTAEQEATTSTTKHIPSSISKPLPEKDEDDTSIEVKLSVDELLKSTNIIREFREVLPIPILYMDLSFCMRLLVTGHNGQDLHSSRSTIDEYTYHLEEQQKQEISQSLLVIRNN
jgi:solute carrier family 50 (sugar transporter)